MIKIKKCNLCGCTDFKVLFKGSDRMYDIKGEYIFNQCKGCGLMFLNPQPSDREIAKHYPIKDYYSLADKSKRNNLVSFIYGVVYSSNSSKLAKLAFLPIRPFLRSSIIVEGGKILDIGCGSGEFLRIMQSNGMVAYGVEPYIDNDIMKSIKNMHIYKCELEAAKFPNDFFDVITINHVIEHVNDPGGLIKEVSRIVKPGGKVIIGTPKSDNLVYKFFKQYWFQLDIPRHLYIYKSTNLYEYAKNNDLKVLNSRDNSSPNQFIISFIYWFNDKYRNRVPLSKIKLIPNKMLYFIILTPLTYILNWLSLGDQIEIILTK